MLASQRVSSALALCQCNTWGSAARLFSTSATRFSSNRGDDWDDDGGGGGGGPPLKLIFDASSLSENATEAQNGQEEAAEKAKRLNFLFEHDVDVLGCKRYKHFPLAGHATCGSNFRKLLVPFHSTTYSALSQFKKFKFGPNSHQKQMDVVKHFGAVHRFRSGSGGAASKKRRPNEKALSLLLRVHCTAHECPTLLKRDFADSFPELNAQANRNLTVIAISGIDTAAKKLDDGDSREVEDGIESSSDVGSSSSSSGLETLQDGSSSSPSTSLFVLAAEEMCRLLISSGHWADFVDPDNGKLYLGDFGASSSSAASNELCLSRFVGLTLESCGKCQVISQQSSSASEDVEDSKEIGILFTSASVQSAVVQFLIKINNGVTQRGDSSSSPGLGAKSVVTSKNDKASVGDVIQSVPTHHAAT